MANFARGLIGGYALGTDIGERLDERRREKQYRETIAPYTPEGINVFGQVRYEPMEGAGEGLQAPEARYLTQEMSSEEREAYAQQRASEGLSVTYDDTPGRGWRVPYSGNVYGSQQEAYARYEKERLQAMMNIASPEEQDRIRSELRNIQLYEAQEERYKAQEARAIEELGLRREEAERAEVRFDWDKAEREARDEQTKVANFLSARDIKGAVGYLQEKYPNANLAYSVTEDGIHRLTANGQVVADGSLEEFIEEKLAWVKGPGAEAELVKLKRDEANAERLARDKEKLDKANRFAAGIELNNERIAQLREVIATDTNNPDVIKYQKEIDRLLGENKAYEAAYQKIFSTETPEYLERQKAMLIISDIDENTPQEEINEAIKIFAGSEYERIRNMAVQLAKQFGVELPSEPLVEEEPKSRPEGTSRIGQFGRGVESFLELDPASNAADKIAKRFISPRGDVRGGLPSAHYGASGLAFLTDTPEIEKQRELAAKLFEFYNPSFGSSPAADLFRQNPDLILKAEEDFVRFYEEYGDKLDVKKYQKEIDKLRKAGKKPPGMKRGGLVRKYKDGGKVEDEKPKKEKPKTDRYKIEEKIVKYARDYGVDSDFLFSIVKNESSFNPKATSRRGAMGLGQLMPATAKELGVTDPYDVDQNLRGTAKYLNQLNKMYKGDLEKVLAAYNYGMGNVRRRGMDWIKENIPETRNFITKVIGDYTERKKGQGDSDQPSSYIRGESPPYRAPLEMPQESRPPYRAPLEMPWVQESRPYRAPLELESYQRRRRSAPVQMPQPGLVAPPPKMYNFNNQMMPAGFQPQAYMNEGGMMENEGGIMEKIRNWRKNREARLKEDAPGFLGRAGLTRGDVSEYGKSLAEALGSTPRPYEVDMPYQPIGDSLEMLMQRRMQQPDLSQYYAYGGQVRDYYKGGDVNGPGTSTSDSIPAMLSDGEYVINAKAVKMIGEDVLDKINALGFRKRGR